MQHIPYLKALFLSFNPGKRDSLRLKYAYRISCDVDIRLIDVEKRSQVW